MKTLRLANELVYDGNKVTVTAALLISDSVEIEIEAGLDTGAELTVLNRVLANRLGLKIESGEPISLGVVSGHSSIGYVHDVPMRVLGHEMTVRAVFCPDWDTDNFLGMEGFFDQTIIAFDHANHHIYY